MSSIMLYGLDAMAHGALIALLAAPAATWLFWRLAAGLGRGAHIALTLVSAYGAVSLVAAAWALLFERTGHEDEALIGALLAGLLLQALACIFLFIVPRKF